MIKKLSCAICLVFAAVFCACDESTSDYIPTAVIEGVIDSDGFPNVIFTSTFADGDDEVVADKLIRWGYVTISDGVDTVVLTGGPNDAVFPPYSYRSFNMRGVPGRTYTLEARYRQYHARAVSTMLPRPEIVGVDAVPSAVCDTLREVTVRIKAPDEVPAFYHISTRVLPDETSFLPSVLGCVRADNPGEIIEAPVYRGKSAIESGDFVSGIPSNRDVIVRVERVTSDIYDFWMNYNEAVLFGGVVFVSTTKSLGGNIDGGFGYFSAQGVATIHLESE